MANELNYCNYDFDDLVSQLQDRLRSREAWRDIYRSSTGQMLIELLAYVLNLSLYYTERRAEESYLLTAKNRSSVINLVSLINYQPRRRTSAVGNLTFSISSPLTKNIYIPKYTRCETSDGTKFLTNEDGVIEKGQTSATLRGIQGELKTVEIVSTGVVNQEYNIPETDIENSGDPENPTFRITVDGEEWYQVSSFINSDSTSRHYRVITELDDTVTVIFGDNVNGKSPEEGSTITIQYIKSAGADGNVTSLDRITTLKDALYDEDGNQVSGVSVTNSSLFLGGDEREDIEEIRYEAPRVFRTGDRAVTREDFIYLIENYPGVANANVWGENEEAAAKGVSADYEMLNKVKICFLLQNWGIADEDFKSLLADYLYDKSMMTVKYEFVTPEILLVVPTLSVKVATGYSIAQTRSDISDVISSKFVLGDTTKLGSIIKYSEIISAVHDLESVAYTSLVLEIKKLLSSSYTSSYDYGAVLESLSIRPETVRLFVDGVYLTTDKDNEDGTGTFLTDSSSGYAVSGTINYTTREVVLDISPTPSEVYVRYQQDNEGNIVPSFNQIAKLEEVDITSITMVS